MTRSTFLSLFLLIGILVPSLTYGQSFAGQKLNSLSITTNPKLIKPNELVTISVESYSVNLDAADIAWSLDGESMKRERGQKTFSFTSKGIGSPTRVTIEVIPLSGTTFKEEIVLRPTNVDLVWEAHTYTPPFYKGRARFSAQAPVTIAALPQINSATGSDRNNLVYHWYRNQSPAPYQSGYGVSSIQLEGNFWGRKEDVRVKVSTLDDSISTENTVSLSPETPQLLVYENSPLLGTLYNRAVIQSFTLNTSEVSFLVAPFYFSDEELGSGATAFTWSMNGNEISNQGNGNVITFRADSNLEGRSLVEVQANNQRASFQGAETNFHIEFN